MDKFPFQLVIERSCPEKGEEIISCAALLRTIPGRRKVYDALWKDRNVIVKVFSHSINARHHLKREWQGLREMVKRNLNSPAPLFYGKTEDDQWAIVVEKINNSSTALDIFNKTMDKSAKLDLLILVCKELARQNSKGVLQKDLHLGNFILQRAKLYALDAAKMRFLSREIGLKKSISQLVLLAGYLPESDKESITQLCQEYFKARSWHFGKMQEALFQKQLSIYRKWGVRYGLRKCLRTSRKHLRIKADGCLAVFDRDFCVEAEAHNFIKQIDELVDKGQVIKSGDTSCVSRLSFNGRDIVVKRYNHKGIIHSLRHTIKRSRAQRGWLHAHRLRMLQIATPQPLAYIEQRRGLLLWRSYLITEYIQGQMLYYFLRDSSTSEEAHSIVNQQVIELLQRLGKYRISHGDLKHTNILVTDNVPVLTDLDGMKVHTWNWMCKIRHTKDLERFAN
jgi:tRNA A-37 threonylcarbamoyl transferase component Bud32